MTRPALQRLEGFMKINLGAWLLCFLCGLLLLAWAWDGLSQMPQ